MCIGAIYRESDLYSFGEFQISKDDSIVMRFGDSL